MRASKCFAVFVEFRLVNSQCGLREDWLVLDRVIDAPAQQAILTCQNPI
jgi:hypothetical protein